MRPRPRGWLWRAGLLAMLLVLSACSTVTATRERLCGQAAMSLLGFDTDNVVLNTENPVFAWLDPGIVDITIADADSGIAHAGHCAFQPSTHPGGLPVLQSVAIDGYAVPPIKLAMLAISLGLQVAYGEDGAPVHAHGSGNPYFAQQLVNGLVLGAIFALVAVGYSLVYAITGVIQLAYGQILTLGAFALILVAAWIGKASAVEPALVLVAGVAALACTGAWGGTAQSLVYRPIERHGHRLTPMIAGIGIGVFLENFMRATQGPGDLWLDRILPGRVVLWDAPGFAVVIGDNQVLILAVALVVGITGSLVMTRSRLGRLYRATTDHPDMAALLGVNTKRLTSWVAASGAGLAALSGIAITLDYGEADASMGFLFGFKALTAAMIGGLGSLPGAVCGGFILGMAEAMWVAYLDASYRDAMVFALLCTALVFRPHGLFQRVTADPPDERRLRQF